MNVERVFRILWGTNLENQLDFAYPVVGASPVFSRAPRADSVMIPNGSGAFAWITGRYYRLKLKAQYFGGPQNFGALGLQAFIDWAADSNQFTLMPNIALPTLTVTGCYLEGPFTQLSPSLEKDSTQTLGLTILHPTVDLGVAWRGLFFEYAAGQSLTDPVRATYARSSVGYEITPNGYLLSHPTDSLCDGHYPGGIVGAGLQTTLLEMAAGNDITFPEALDNAAWDKTNNVTVTANNATAPDQNQTADLVVETVTNGIHCIASASFTVAASDVQTGLVFVRAGGRYKGVVYFADGIGAAGANRFGANYDLSLGTITSSTLGTGTLTASKIIPLSGGSFMIWVRGSLGGPTTSYFNCRLFDNTGAGSYAGDAVSGTYFWGATAVHGTANIIASYTPTTAAADKLLYSSFTPVAQALWFYTKIVEVGDSAGDGGGATSRGLVMLGNSMRLMLFKEGASVGYRLLFDNGSGTQVRSPGGSGVQLAMGDIAEFFGMLYADGSVELHVSVNGGAPTLHARSAADAPAQVTFPGGLGLGTARPADYVADGVAAINVARFGPLLTTGPFAVTSLAAARYQ